MKKVQNIDSIHGFSATDATQAKRLNLFEEDLYRELQKWKRRASP